MNATGHGGESQRHLAVFLGFKGHGRLSPRPIKRRPMGSRPIGFDFFYVG
jgi:hypothetical protein